MGIKVYAMSERGFSKAYANPNSEDDKNTKDNSKVYIAPLFESKFYPKTIFESEPILLNG